MNLQRLDPFLALRLSESRAQTPDGPEPAVRSPSVPATPAGSETGASSYDVFIRTRRPLNSEELTELQSYLGPDLPGGRTTYPATLSRAAIETLSDRDWVFRISASQNLTPLDVPPA